MKESYELKDIITAFVGYTRAVGESQTDSIILHNLKLAIPSLFEVVMDIFNFADYEANRPEWSMQEIGKYKLKWALEFKGLFDSILPEKDDETTVS